MDRAVAPVVSTVLMIAVTVVIAAVLATFVFGFGEEVEETAPVVGQSSGEFDAHEVGDKSSSQIVTIRHIAGDDIPVEEMEVAVSATCEEETSRGRLVNLPLDSNKIEGANIERANIFDQRYDSLWAGDLGALQSDTFTSGEKLSFRLPDSKCSVPQDGTVTVRVVHVPTNAIVIEQQLTAQ